jgi:hypothetical protein
MIDASGAKEAVAKEIWDAVKSRLEPQASRRTVEDAVALGLG